LLLVFWILVFVPMWFYLVVETFATRVHSSSSMSPDWTTTVPLPQAQQLLSGWTPFSIY